jgi:ribulose 1,5-bisphosphate carboxylase large subunit-like protein
MGSKLSTHGSAEEEPEMGLDQSDRYADLSLSEAELIEAGQHVLTAYVMKPKEGYDYLSTAAHFAAESSTGTNVPPWWGEPDRSAELIADFLRSD